MNCWNWFQILIYSDEFLVSGLVFSICPFNFLFFFTLFFLPLLGFSFSLLQNSKIYIHIYVHTPYSYYFTGFHMCNWHTNLINTLGFYLGDIFPEPTFTSNVSVAQSLALQDLSLLALDGSSCSPTDFTEVRDAMPRLATSLPEENEEGIFYLNFIDPD